MDDHDQQQQLRIIGTVLKHHPAAASTLALVKAVLATAQFPINSLVDFTATVGRGDVLPFGTQTLSLADLQRIVPAYYFPIVNENDLIAKLCDLTQRQPSAQAVAGDPAHAAAHERSVLIEARAAKPPDSVSPPDHLHADVHKLAAERAPNLAGRIGGARH